MTLRLSRHNVRPNDFTGSRGVCQNLDCLAPLEEPFTVLTIQTPGGPLETVLCCNCVPRTTRNT